MKSSIGLGLLALFSLALPFFPGASEALPFWPSFAALIFVLIFKRPALGLTFGAICGAFYLNLETPLNTIPHLIKDHFLATVAGSWNISILFFTLILGGFAGILQQGGGLQALAQFFLKKSKEAGKTIERTAFYLGIFCFFDGLANALLVGRLTRPLAKSYGVSKVRLAYIIDSTSSPVACLALASTWIAYQLSMIREGLSVAGIDGSPYPIFLQSWPANFYCLFSLLLVGTVIQKSWIIGPMKRMETSEERATVAVTKKPISEPEIPSGTPPDRGPMRITAALSSLAFLIASLFVGLWWNGRSLAPENAGWMEVIGHADSALVLLIVSLGSVAWAIAAHWLFIKESVRNLDSAFWEGAMQMAKPLTVLLAAWALGSTLKDLNTAKSLAQLLQTTLSPSFLPLIVFLCGALISFFTGTSWGTMGILTPLAIPAAIALDPGGDPSYVAWIVGAVFSGAVFGDHCSPLSDTTIVSSIACDVEPLDHVRTQLPYALIAAAWSALFGFLPIGFGVNPWICLMVAGPALLLLPRILPQKRVS
ncbi:MAG: Na+/H+ antiporter NhaC family protein [Verrucomicrobiota bacterium]